MWCQRINNSFLAFETLEDWHLYCLQHTTDLSGPPYPIKERMSDQTVSKLVIVRNGTIDIIDWTRDPPGYVLGGILKIIPVPTSNYKDEIGPFLRIK